MGAAGRDFHNFNMLFRDNEEYEVVAFTAAQIPGIAGRTYPPSLAGRLYPEGIPIYDESELPKLIKELKVDEVLLSYSDLTYEDVMRKASIALSSGADFRLASPHSTMLEPKKPTIAVTAVRTGAGKSTVSRKLVRILQGMGLKPVIVRHPMPYEDLEKSVVVRISSYRDLDGLSIEEREEFEPYIEMGVVAFEGVDYERVLRAAEPEGDIIIWDGGNNDTPFFRPGLYITVADPTRPGQEVGSYPGEINLRMADVVVISKVNSVPRENVDFVRRNVRALNPNARIVEAEFVVSVENPEAIRGRRVLVIEDGPSVTHGGMPYGAGYIAAKKYGAAEVVDPRPYAVGMLKRVYSEFPHMGPVLPTVGYNEEQRRDLRETINRVPCDVVLLGSPSLIYRYIEVDKPFVRVRYELVERGSPTLAEIVEEWLGSAIR